MNEPDYEDEHEFVEGVDGCHHGLGWDEICEACEAEEWEERRQAARNRELHKRPDLFEQPTDTSNPQSSEQTK